MEPAGDWLTYRQLGERLGCTANAARMHAYRRGWSRRSPNRVGDSAQVLVPEGAAVRDRVTHDAAQFAAQPNEVVLAHVQAVEALRDQLAIANRRIDELLAERRRLIDAILARVPWWKRWFR